MVAGCNIWFYAWTKRNLWLGCNPNTSPPFEQDVNNSNRIIDCHCWKDLICYLELNPPFKNNPHIHIPRTQLNSIFEGQPPKTRPFPIKTGVVWVLGKNIHRTKNMLYIPFIKLHVLFVPQINQTIRVSVCSSSIWSSVYIDSVSIQL